MWHSQPGAFPQAVAQRANALAAGAGAHQRGARRFAARRGHPRRLGGGGPLRGVARRVPDRAPAGRQSVLVAPPGGRDAAQRGGERAGGHRPLRRPPNATDA